MPGCTTGCAPDLADIYADPDGDPIPGNLIVNESAGILVYWTGNTLKKWDISGPIPVFDSALSLTTDTDTSSLYVQGLVAYVTTFDDTSIPFTTFATIHSIDITTSPPTLLDSLALPANYGGPAEVDVVSGSRAYVLDFNASFNTAVRVVDVSSPSSMALLGTIGFRTGPGPFDTITPSAITASGDTVYILGTASIPNQDGLFTYDCTDVSTNFAPTETDRVLFSTDYRASQSYIQLFLAGGYLYGTLAYTPASPDTKVVVIASESTLNVESFLPLDGRDGNSIGLYVLDDNLYIVNDLSTATVQDGQIEVWNISDKTAPTVCKTTAAGAYSKSGIALGDVSELLYTAINDGSGVPFDGRFLGVGSFQVWDVATCISGAPPATGGFLACRVLGNYLFVADNENSALKIYNVETPATPSLIATLALSQPPLDIAIQDSVITVAAGSEVYYITIDDITDPQIVVTYNG